MSHLGSGTARTCNTGALRCGLPADPMQVREASKPAGIEQWVLVFQGRRHATLQVRAQNSNFNCALASCQCTTGVDQSQAYLVHRKRRSKGIVASQSRRVLLE